MTDRSRTHAYASPPCSAHELTESEHGWEIVDAATARDVARWRRATREDLIAARLEIDADERGRVAREVEVELDRLIEPRPGLVVGLYWPFRGELDLRGWMSRSAGTGVRLALPVVDGKGSPLVFREWRPGCRMERGVWNIPVPADGEALIPNVVVAPVVGFDRQCYRLGYGGGFYDRTLASLSPRPSVIGVGHPGAAVDTIFPQPYDVPMDVIVTGAGRVRRREPER